MPVSLFHHQKTNMHDIISEDFLLDTENDENCSCPSPSEETDIDDQTTRQHKKGIYTIVDRSKRLKASNRERRRRHVLNHALEQLRQKVPCVNNVGQRTTKLPKIEVLRMAIDYIAVLSGILNCSDPSPPFHKEPQFLSYQPINNNNINNNNSFEQTLLHEVTNQWNNEYIIEPTCQLSQQQNNYQYIPCSPNTLYHIPSPEYYTPNNYNGSV